MFNNPSSAKEKTKALDLALGQIEKQFGKGVDHEAGRGTRRVASDVIPTGSIALDMALGVGGIPRGRVVEIYGPESSGKTTLALHDHRQRPADGRHRRCSSTPSTRSTRPTPRSCGVDVDEPAVVPARLRASRRSRSPRPWSGRGAVDVVVIDSVAALVPRAELEGDMGDAQVGLQARLMSQALRKLTGIDLQSQDVRGLHQPDPQKIGVMFGNPETTAGGRALKFYASVRLDIRRIGAHQAGRPGHRQPHAGQGRQEQGRRAVPRRRVRHPLQRRHLAEGEFLDFAVDKPSSTRPARGSRSARNASARAAKTRACSSRNIRTSGSRSRRSCSPKWAFA